MKRFIFRYRGEGEMPSADIKRITSLPDAKVIDQSSRMLLVETSEEIIPRAAQEMPNWAMSAEQFTPLPPQGRV